jgi:16S rRNA (cytosine967-C5)-methyltransferase
METVIYKKNQQDRVLMIAYLIVLNVFKRSISTRQSKESKTIKYYTLSGSDKAKCNDLVQNALRFTVYLDKWINSIKTGRIRVEMFCILRLALTDMLVRNKRKETVLKKYSDLAFSLERTKHSKDHLRYFIHLIYSEMKKKTFKPAFLFEQKIRKILLSQYSPESVKKIETAFSSSPPQDLSIKSYLITKKYFKDHEGSSVHPNHFRMSKNVSLLKTKGYYSGDWWVQNLSASLPVELAPFCLKGKNVLDLCCAPGGKSFQLADKGANVTSIDKSEKRLKLMRENLKRLGYCLELICSDIFEYKPKKPFDVILLDPPCTATGTIGKNPDLQLLNPLENLKSLFETQQNMLQRCSGWLSENGCIIYSVCSLLKEEGENQIDHFLKNNKKFKRVFPKTSHYTDQAGFKIYSNCGIRIMPFFENKIGGSEGFFISYLQLKGNNT